MPKPTVEEAIEKIQKLGDILKDVVANTHAMTHQEEKAIHEAIRIESMHNEKFNKEHKHGLEKEKKHHL